MLNIKLKRELEKLGLKTFQDIAEVTGHKPDSLKDVMRPSKNVPKWGKLVLYVVDHFKENYEPKATRGDIKTICKEMDNKGV